MVLKNENINELLQSAQNKLLVCYGSGGYLRHLCGIYAPFGFAERIDFVADSNAKNLGNEFCYGNVVRPLGTIDDFLNECAEDFVLVITTGAIYEVFMELQKRETLQEIPVYVCAFLAAQPPTYQLPIRDYKRDRQMIPKKIHYCWFSGNPIPEQFKKYIESWRKFCPEYEIIQWNENNYDVSKNRYMFGAYQAKKWAFVSDYAHLDIIYQHGGIYLDIDVELLKPLDYFLYDSGFCGLQCASEVATGLGFGATPGNEIVRKWRDYYNNVDFCNTDGTYNLTPSPVHQTQVLRQQGFCDGNHIQQIEDMKIYPTDVFCPIDVAYLFERITENTFSVHHFAATWADNAKVQAKAIRAKQAQELLKLVAV